MSFEDVVGRTGTVVTRIRGAEGPGEVTVTVGGTSNTFIAYATEPIDRFASVLVIAWRGARTVEVVPVA